jgi:hypothetical protein
MWALSAASASLLGLGAPDVASSSVLQVSIDDDATAEQDKPAEQKSEEEKSADAAKEGDTVEVAGEAGAAAKKTLPGCLAVCGLLALLVQHRVNNQPV